MTNKPTPKPKERRNTKNIGFSAEEYQEIVTAAEREGVYPRQLIMLKIRRK